MKNSLVCAFALLISSSLSAQLKVGNNPTTLATDANFQVEGPTGNALFVQRSTGQVGVGTVTPNVNAALEISNSGKGLLIPRLSTANRNLMSSVPAGMLIYNSTVDSFQFRNASGWLNLMVNTGSDLRLVNGTSHISSDAGPGSNGTTAGAADVIAIGASAGSANSASGSVFIGHEAGKSNSNGTFNTFIGYQSGKVHTTGPWNTYVGYQAGLSSTNGNDNTYMGYAAGAGSTSVFYNTYIGSKAGQANVTGVANTAIGARALVAGNANRNTAVGAEALMSTTTGGDNTAMGREALPNNNIGSGNAIFGSAAMYHSTSGDNNTALGGGAGYQTTTGSNNTFVGSSAGGNVTTGSNNISIGASSQPHSLTVNNQLSIGNLIYGNGLDGSNAVISTGNIGIGVDSATATLHLRAGAAAAGKAPLKFNSGTNLTTPENGAVEYDGTNYYATSGGTRYTLAKTIKASVTYDFTSTTAQSSNTQPFTVTGAAVGDFVVVNPPSGSVPSNSCYTAYIDAANTVQIRFNNFSTVAIDPPSGTFQILVVKF